MAKVLVNVKRGCVRVMDLSQRHTNLASAVLVDKVLEFQDKQHDEAGNRGHVSVWTKSWLAAGLT